MLRNRISADQFPSVNEGTPPKSRLLVKVVNDSDYEEPDGILSSFIPRGGQAFNVPFELRALPQWVGWNGVQVGGKLTKQPVNVQTGRPTDVTNPANWNTFNDTLEGAQQREYDGIGFAFSASDPFVGIDLDEVIDPATGGIDPDALATIDRFKSYAEVTPSGTGVHIILRGKLPPGGRKRGDRECYDQDRFFTFTGREATPFGIAEGSDELARWHAETFPAPEKVAATLAACRPVDMSDQQLLAKIAGSVQKDKFAKLWAGDTTGYPSGSEADLALCNILAFWWSRDAASIDRLFRSSGLMRAKWDAKRGDSTYGRRTVEKAIAGTLGVYDPNYNVGPKATFGATVGQAAAPEQAEPRFKFIDSTTFLATDYRQEFLIPKIFARGQPAIIGGPHKTLKTSLIVDMAVSMATATAFLGHFPIKKPVRVGVASGESGAFTLKETMLRVCRAKGVDPRSIGDMLRWEFTLPVLSSNLVMDDFAGVLQMHEVDVVFIDPAYLCLGDVDAKNVFEVGNVLRAVAQHLLSKQITPVIAHHSNRQIKAGEVMELGHLSYSGFAVYARQWLLLNRREAFNGDGKHELWLSVGGSAGHGGQWSLRVEEGMVDENFEGRKWDVTVQTPDEVRADKDDRNEKDKDYELQKEQMSQDKAVMRVVDEASQKATGPLTRNSRATALRTPDGVGS